MLSIESRKAPQLGAVQFRVSKGTRKGCPYGGMRQVDAVEDGGPGQARGHPRGVPLRGFGGTWSG